MSKMCFGSVLRFSELNLLGANNASYISSFFCLSLPLYREVFQLLCHTYEYTEIHRVLPKYRNLCQPPG